MRAENGVTLAETRLGWFAPLAGDQALRFIRSIRLLALEARLGSGASGEFVGLSPPRVTVHQGRVAGGACLLGVATRLGGSEPRELPRPSQPRVDVCQGRGHGGADFVPLGGDPLSLRLAVPSDRLPEVPDRGGALGSAVRRAHPTT